MDQNSTEYVRFLSRPQKDISLDKNKQKNRKKGPVQWFQNLIHYPSMFFSEVKSG